MCVMNVKLLELAEEMDDVFAEKDLEARTQARKTDKIKRPQHQDKAGVGQFDQERELKTQARTPGFELNEGVL